MSNRFLPGVVVRESSDPTRLYLVTATSDWGFEIKGSNWIAWDKSQGWRVLGRGDDSVVLSGGDPSLGSHPEGWIPA